MLCVSIFMAQVVFIIGIDETKKYKNTLYNYKVCLFSFQGVCTAIAILLQYLFLVTLM